MTPETIARLRKLDREATAGPWTAEGDSSIVIQDICVAQCRTFSVTTETASKNSAFIAAARTALPDALDAIEEAYKALHAFCSAMAFTPSSAPGALERDLNNAYEMARKILNGIAEKGAEHGRG